MKRLAVLLFVFAALSAYSQKKPKIGQAEEAWKIGDYQTAKAVVDAAAEHEKTMNDSKVWFIRGLVYASMDTAGYEGGDIKEARSAWDKAREMKKGGENFIAGVGGSIVAQATAENAFWGHFLNMGVDQFQSADEKSAIVSFEKCAIIMPDSLIAYYYGGLAATSIKEYDVALNNFTNYIDKGGEELDAYERKAYILSGVQKDHQAAYDFILKAKEKYPDEKGIIDWEFRLLFALDKVDAAVTALQNAIEKEPANPELRFNLGVMYERMEQMEDARTQYLKAVEIDPDYYNANYNVGVLFRNDLVAAGKERNNLGISDEDMKRDEELTAQIKEFSKKALPYWEKCNELQPDEQTTLETLNYIYVQLKEYDKAEAILARMEELGYKN